MAIIDVSDIDFEEKVIKSQKPVLLDFWAPWCGPCRMAEPVLQELSEQYKDKVDFMKLNVDDNPKTAMNFQVRSIPATVLFSKGKEIDRQIGFAGKQAYEDLIKKGI